MGIRGKLKKYIKKIKQKIIKKVTLTNIQNKDKELVYELHLSNFWSLRKKIEVAFQFEDSTQSLPFNFSKRQLFIKVPKNLLNPGPRVKIELTINNKKMWIKKDLHFEETVEQSFLIDNHYFFTRVDKSIFLLNRFDEYHFKNEKLWCTGLTDDYNNVQFTFEPESVKHLVKHGEKTELEIFALQNHKLKTLDADYQPDSKKVTINDLSSMSTGLWKLYLHFNRELYPLCLTEQKAVQFDSYNHQIEIAPKHNEHFSFRLQPHYYSSEVISIARENQEHVTMHIRTNTAAQGSNYSLILEDTKHDEEHVYNLEQTAYGLRGYVPVDHLWSNFSNKRFFLAEENDQPKKFQFLLKKSNLTGSGLSFTEVIESQKMLFQFYARKDRSLGFKIFRPVLPKKVTDIDKLTITGCIGSLDAFIDCKAYLTFEERNSLETIQIPVQSGAEFTIELEHLPFVELKSKDKTIIDLFVEIIDKENNSIRKEKIKYQSSNYKKDNYYGRKALRDSDLNLHHFLITTTPFDNLKIESFMIPKDIVIPKDTSIKDEKVWLLGERYNTAQDNGIVLYRWLKENTDIEAYYVIEEDAEDYKEIKDDPNVLVFGSPKHYEVAFKASVLLGTHDLENLLPFKTAKGFFHYENTYKVFLQHGVLGRKNVEYHKKYYDDPFDLFIVSSDAEKYDIVVNKMGYEEDEVAVTGLARFDNLIQEKPPKDILLMPTWRDWINTDQQFLESDYFNNYLQLIQNERLHELLNKYNVNLNFYPHYRAQDFFKNHVDSLDNRINFIPLGSKRVQQLLIDHALLITDYSTVSFDFLKMDKPVIYYHFDVRRFFRKGILRPIDETFIGGIAYTEEEMIDLIEDRLKNNLANYSVDISGVIKYQDKRNCERIYEAVINGLEKASLAKNGQTETV
ncbi:teichoic acid biosynthesis protein [Pueribacillus theae]|uniref:Teichoic acid biosynthesis protein n=1 Tax=Pueribacillus theae TaxID=2171751 RepID=A0A2U1K6T3_9BACI|nr:CDP-glycerol glycerophosphotransferase family protein [Pueribacillus theae]PWA12879.1 teichoic acid biosynthesis protein [Pueribacillus theae]